MRPTLGTTLGIGCVLLASMLFFSVLQTRPVLHEMLIAVFMVITTPVTLMLLARAALYRDRREGGSEVPHPPSPKADSRGRVDIVARPAPTGKAVRVQFARGDTATRSAPGGARAQPSSARRSLVLSSSPFSRGQISS